jgi:hypothetical protein
MFDWIERESEKKGRATQDVTRWSMLMSVSVLLDDQVGTLCQDNRYCHSDSLADA